MVADFTIHVLVVDDSEAVRYGLRQSLSAFADLEWVGDAAAGSDALELCETLHPDVVLLDARLPHLDLPQLTRAIRLHFPSIQVIVLASFEDAAALQPILTAGAALSLPKDAPITQLADAVRYVVQGHASKGNGNRPAHST